MPTSSQDGNGHLQHAATLIRGCFCVDTLHSISIFLLFYPSIQLTFFRILIKKGSYFDQTLCHKLSVQFTLSFITSFFEELFFQSWIFL